mmetsp:Transcript_25483/g.71088  ORF Transcript_25483/g.71088 Transcript_25483/m.71088 type:complete len:302 (+) Transcript_25483:894-1799(+)
MLRQFSSLNLAMLDLRRPAYEFAQGARWFELFRHLLFLGDVRRDHVNTLSANGLDIPSEFDHWHFRLLKGLHVEERAPRLVLGAAPPMHHTAPRRKNERPSGAPGTCHALAAPLFYVLVQLRHDPTRARIHLALQIKTLAILDIVKEISCRQGRVCGNARGGALCGNAGRGSLACRIARNTRGVVRKKHVRALRAAHRVDLLELAVVTHALRELMRFRAGAQFLARRTAQASLQHVVRFRHATAPRFAGVDVCVARAWQRARAQRRWSCVPCLWRPNNLLHVLGRLLGCQKTADRTRLTIW